MVEKKERKMVREVAFAIRRVFRDKQLLHRTSQTSKAAARERMGKEVLSTPNYELRENLISRNIVELIGNTCIGSALIVYYYKLVVFGLCFLTYHHNDDVFEHILVIQTDIKKWLVLSLLTQLKIC